MMEWFRKKKEQKQEQEPKIELSAIPETPPECRHKWRDFDWYVESEWTSESDSSSSPISFTAKIIEPYVCCLCKKRENHILYKTNMRHVPKEKLDQIIENWKIEYKDHIRGRAIVEDEVKDMQMTIDRQYLEIVAACYPEKLGLTEEQKQKLHLSCAGG